MSYYYHNENGERIGPYTEEELMQLARQGTIRRETIIENENGTTMTFAEATSPPDEEARKQLRAMLTKSSIIMAVGVIIGVILGMAGGLVGFLIGAFLGAGIGPFLPVAIKELTDEELVFGMPGIIPQILGFPGILKEHLIVEMEKQYDFQGKLGALAMGLVVSPIVFLALIAWRLALVTVPKLGFKLLISPFVAIGNLKELYRLAK